MENNTDTNETEKQMKAAANTTFVTAVNKHRKGQKSWNGAQSKALIKDLMIEDGKTVTLDEEDELTLTVLADPTLDTQMEVFAKLAKKKGCKLDKYQLINIRRVMNHQLFRQELVNAKALPKSDKPQKTSMKTLLEV